MRGMKRRVFCKATASVLLAWGLNPMSALANPNNKVLSGELFVNKNLAKDNFENLGNALIETKKLKTILKVENDFYLVRPGTKLKFVSNQLKEIVKGSVHAVFGKRKKELKIKIPKERLVLEELPYLLTWNLRKNEVTFATVMEKPIFMTIRVNCYNLPFLKDTSQSPLQTKAKYESTGLVICPTCMP